MKLNAIEGMTVSRVLLALVNLEGRCGSKYMEELLNELEMEVLIGREDDTDRIAARIFSLYSAERDVLFEEWKESHNRALETHVRYIHSMARREEIDYDTAFRQVIKMLSPDGEYHNGNEGEVTIVQQAR